MDKNFNILKIMFHLDEKLKSDVFEIADLNVCKLLLMNNSNYPWLILVPKIENAIELTDLDFKIQQEILFEINYVTNILKKICQEIFDKLPHKFNIANLGNIVRQLHIHIIARFEDDETFPKPVFGNSDNKKYDEKNAKNLIKKIQENLVDDDLQKKILYRAVHRGCKETDHLIGNFAKKNYKNFMIDELLLFKNFIEEDDLLIYDWILNKTENPKIYDEIIQKIRIFHDLSL